MKTVEKLEKLFEASKMLKFDEILEVFPNLSEISIRKYLKTLKAQSSVNCNGRYYILPYNHKFNNEGLLRFKKVVFHRENSLLKAIVWLIEHSAKGMSPADLDALLLTKSHHSLTNLFRNKKVSRIGRGGAGSYIYYSRDEKIASKQLKCRQEQSQIAEKEKEDSKLEDHSTVKASLNSQDVLDVMHMLLQHPDFTAKSIALSLQRRGKKISTKLVRKIFEVYQLKGKKS